ncbi:MAG TPA: M15 family metallopeptidase [Actinomycetes bacterium]
MGARLRALLLFLCLMAAIGGLSFLLITGSGSVGTTAKPAIAVAGTESDLSLFKGEVLVWANGGFSDAEVSRVLGSVRVAEISAVRTGLLPVAGRSADDPVIPVETMAVDPRAYASAVGRPGVRLGAMLDNGVVLSSSGAKLRGLRAGDQLELSGGRTLRVRGVVDDRMLAGYEAAVSAERGKPLGVGRVGYLLVSPRGPLDALRTSLGRLLRGRQLAYLLPGDRPWFRGGDGTLPLAQLKLRLGEFAVPRLHDPAPDPAWQAANLAGRSVPLLGDVRCHRLILDDLAAAMAEVARQDLAGLVSPSAFHGAGGCLEAKVQPGGASLSSGDWGIGFDLSDGGKQDPRRLRRLAAVMARHGFTWGGHWLRPRPGHFEWVGQAQGG